MPREALYEESAQCARESREKKWYMTFSVLCIIFVAITLIHLLICFMTVPATISQYKNPAEGETPLTGMGLALNLILMLGMLLAFGLCAFLFFRFRRRFNVSYDYLFVEDELRITKVFNGKKRKHQITMRADSIMQVGYCEKPSFERLLAGQRGRKPKFMTPNQEPMDGKEFIYILYSSSGDKSLYVIECRQMMLEYLVRAVGRTKFERE